MVQLPNNCRCSEISVTPSNWKKAASAIKKSWKIHYRFYDPRYEAPMQVTIKAGINKIKDLQQRRAFVEQRIVAEWEKLLRQGYNPFDELNADATLTVTEILPSTLFIDALKKVLEKVTIAHETRIDVNCVVNGVALAATQLKLATLPISSISRKHLKAILEQCAKINTRWSARRYNLYRAYLLLLFRELVEREVIPCNPVRDISKMKEVKRLRKVLNAEQRQQIDVHLQKVDYRFWLFVNLFFHSGARLQELVQLRKADVDLTAQKYKTVIRKGRSHTEVERTIKTIALPFWEAFLKEARKEDYLFGVDFTPAEKPMIADTITRRWQKRVKRDLKIQVDLYSLKHLNTTETVSLVGEASAAQQNAHTSTAMVISTYDVHRSKRQHEILKTVGNTFA